MFQAHGNGRPNQRELGSDDLRTRERGSRCARAVQARSSFHDDGVQLCFHFTSRYLEYRKQHVETSINSS